MRPWTPLLALACVTTAAFAGEPKFEKKRLSDVFLSEGATYGDFNKDGKTDVASGPYWWEGPAFEKRHEYFNVGKWDPAKEYSDCFLMYTGDFNHDGWTDILVVGFPTRDARWYQNPGAGASSDGGHWVMHPIIDAHLNNESPVMADVLKDGTPCLVSNVGSVMGWLSPDPADANKPWVFHAVAAGKGADELPASFTHGVGVGDVNGDGRQDILCHKGWWEQPETIEEGKPWPFHPASFGPAAAQMFAYDVDGDGINDVIASIHAHQYGVAWFKQTKDGKFEKHLIVGSPTEQGSTGVVFSQPHAMDLADVDGDGVMDLITGKRRFAHGDHGDADPLGKPVTYWFGLTREGGEVKWTPHLVDDDTGVGTQVTATDLNEDGKRDILVGNKMGTTIFLQATADATAAGTEAGADHSKRKVLVFSMTKGFHHASIPTGQKMVEKLGEDSKEFTAVVSDDLANFDPDKIGQFSAIMFLNTTLEIPFSDEQKGAFMGAISSGKVGFVGIHAATDTLYQWPAYGEMIGGHFDGHPWTADTKVTIRREVDNPITAPLPPEFDLTEEIYQMKEYDRAKCNVCLSLDTAKTDMTRNGIKRTDGDFPICWVKDYGQGRVFYTSLGHNDAVYQREDYQKHVLAGLKWVMGDIDVDVKSHPLPESK